MTDVSAAAFLRTDPIARKILEGRAGKMVQASATERGLLEELVVRYPAENAEQFSTHFSRLRVSRVDGELQAQVEAAELESEVRLGSGTIRSSLFASTYEARIPDPVAVQMAEIFSTDIDFHRELRRGDTFSVIYEALTADGEAITWNQAAGRMLAGEFVNNGRSHSAVWFKDADSKGGYYGFNGESKRRAFLSSPMEFSRVTSGFSMRMHPIHKTWRAHLGVDYGAPTGTPVRSVGDGVASLRLAERLRQVVKIRTARPHHAVRHLSRIDVRKGQRIDQAPASAPWATGWATGPHLHFEVRVKDEHKDPLIIAKTSEAVVLSDASRARFVVTARQLRQQLEVAAINAQLYAGRSE